MGRKRFSFSRDSQKSLCPISIGCMIHTEKDSKDPRVKKYDPDYTWTKEKEDERMNIPESILSRLTEEQKNRIGNAKTPEELLAIAKETGYELSGEELNALAGGDSWYECSNYDSCIDDFCPPVQ